MQKTITRLSVHAFIEQALPGGDLFADVTAYGKLQEGTRVHQRIQRQAGPGTAAEAPVFFRRESALSSLEIGGRMDGWRIDGTGPTVVEIKTTWRDPGALGEGLEAHWNQARVYGAIRCLQDGFPRMGVELIYVHLPGGDARTLRREYGGPELGEWLLGLCDAWLRAADRERAGRDERDAALSRLDFPYDGFRAGQREMAARIYRTVRDGGACLLQAPTGIGKTMAALYSALKALGEGHCGRIFYLTARTTGKIAAGEALSRLRARTPLRSVTLTAKEKCCPAPGTPCQPAWCARAAGFFDRLGGAMEEVSAAPAHWGREELLDLAGRHGLCPFELSLSVAERCDVVVCDYNYAFDPRVYLRRFFEEPGDGALLIDEAHHLADRARDMYSAELSRQTALRLARLLRGKQEDEEAGKLKKAVGRLNRALLELSRQAGEGEGTVFEEPPDAVTRAARAVAGAIEPMLGGMDRRPFDEAMRTLFFECRAYFLAAEAFDACCAAYMKGKGPRVTVRVYCVDPASRLAARYEKVRAAALYSASLTPFSYYRRLLGLGDADTLSLPSPFPAENLCVLVDPGASTAYRHREATLPQVAGALCRLTDGRPGHYMAFFPSYRYMMRVYGLIAGEHPEKNLLVQRPGMGEAEREEFLRRFDAGERPLLGFAVMGGAFGEGVDLMGDRLIGAAIVGVGLPQLCIERDLIRRYHEDRGEDGYAYAYALPGFTRVLQAAGRVIRSAEDRGVVLLIDPRFLRWNVRELMPPWWEPVKTVDDPGTLERELRKFWE